MTVPATLAALQTRLLTITPPNPPGGTLTVYADPREAVSVANFPSIVLALAPQVDNAAGAGALGLGRDDYTVAMYVLVGPRQMALNELHARVIPWPRLLLAKLAADLTLGGLVSFIGYGFQTDDYRLFSYRIGAIPWADGMYFGVKALLPVVEEMPLTMG